MTDQTCVVGEMAKCDSPECGKDVALGYLGSSGAVQFAGVLATTCGFFVFLSWHWEGLVKDQGDRMRQILLMGWPVILAFCIVGLSLAMMCVSFIRTPQRSLRWVFWGVLLPDTLLLGALVWNTGGPSESVFTPIFLLIPAVATSYCHPGKRFFISLLVAVVGVNGRTHQRTQREHQHNGLFHESPSGCACCNQCFEHDSPDNQAQVESQDCVQRPGQMQERGDPETNTLCRAQNVPAVNPHQDRNSNERNSWQTGIE